MKAGLLKYLFVCLFIFTVMERTGFSVVSILMQHSSHALTFSEPDGSAQEQENSKESSPKEFWFITNEYDVPAPPANTGAQKIRPEDCRFSLIYYPSVPTPPPNSALVS